MAKKVLLLDVDEVVCFTGFLPLINEFMGTDYVIDDFTEYFIDDVAIPKERFSEFNAFIREKNMYDYARLLPKAVETLKDLNEVYDIHVCSSCINPLDMENSGRLFVDKFHYLLKTLPFLKPEKFIFTGVKGLFKADVQIDDRVNNLVGDVGIKILFPSYHNKDISDEELRSKGIIRAGYDWRDGWDEIRRILLEK